MVWYLIPSVILCIGLLGLFLNVKAYQKGESISIKKVLVTLMLIFLGAGVFLQKMEVVDVPQLRQLLLAFDTEASKKIDDARQKELDDKQNAIQEKIKNIGKK